MYMQSPSMPPPVTVCHSAPVRGMNGDRDDASRVGVRLWRVSRGMHGEKKKKKKKKKTFCCVAVLCVYEIPKYQSEREIYNHTCKKKSKKK
jgi:hypothetical protein